MQLLSQFMLDYADISKLHNKFLMPIMWSAAIPKVTLKCYNPRAPFDPVTMETDPYSKNRWYLEKKDWKKGIMQVRSQKARGDGGGNKV